MRGILETLMLTAKNADEAQERKFYTIGLILSVLLTAASFASVMMQYLERGTAITVLIVLALAQILVHLRIFLHIDLGRQKREDLLMLLFTVLLLGIMAFGTLWVVGDMNTRMMDGHMEGHGGH